MPDEHYLIPQRLDEPPKYLWWDFDVAILAMGAFVLGIVSDNFLMFTTFGIIAAGAYQKLKAGKSRGFGMHLLYWYMPFNFGFRITPPSSIREFIG
jgi:conjugal transfer pilus assembly protein TraL